MYKFGPRNKDGKSDYVIRSFDNKRIDISPECEKDKDYQELMKWIVAGNIPERREPVIEEPVRETFVEEESATAEAPIVE